MLNKTESWYLIILLYFLIYFKQKLYLSDSYNKFLRIKVLIVYKPDLSFVTFFKQSKTNYSKTITNAITNPCAKILVLNSE